MNKLGTLISMLFNYNFKRCKYCNYYFIPQHNRQVHCKSQHRKSYRQERYIEKKCKERRQEPQISYIDSNGKFIKMKPRDLKPGSMYSTLPQHRCTDFNKELNEVRKQVKTLGLR